MKIRRQVYELNIDDLNKFPVWEFALDEEGEDNQDEATVRPYELSGALNPADGMFIVGALFTLADGSKMKGYLTPPVQGDNSLGTLHPIIITASGQIGFWCGVISPSTDELTKYYSLLGRLPKEVFPLQFESQVELIGGSVSGSVEGFIVLENMKNRKTRILR